MASSRGSSAGTTRKNFRTGGWNSRYVKLGLALIAGLAVALLLSLPKVEKTIQDVTLPLRHEDIIRQQANEKGVDPDLIAAVIYAESKFHDQTSTAGARGLMQITPATADTIEKLSGGKTFNFDDLANPDLNIRYGTFYLHYLLERYGGNETAALAAYNAGPGQADAWGGSDMNAGNITISETRHYVAKVLEKKKEYRRKYGKQLGFK